ncbi:MAG: prepilin-type N-terminal cleavage/methylation domain-containing protein [Chloroflexi bacterium]|nr:MAG: prepilin-type N-terminal cleavage/methylation domain-containing protein [Chloroflexota bacterium]
MNPQRSYLRGQGGFTLVELIVSVAIGALLLSALTSVVLTSWRGATVASSRVEASSQIRNFEYFAYDDFARSGIPNGSACPCTTQPLLLSGVTYTWDGGSFLDRAVASTGATEHAATDVSAFTWYVDTNSTVVVSLTITIQAYSESQTFRFYPRVNP